MCGFGTDACGSGWFHKMWEFDYMKGVVSTGGEYPMEFVWWVRRQVGTLISDDSGNDSNFQAEFLEQLFRDWQLSLHSTDSDCDGLECYIVKLVAMQRHVNEGVICHGCILLFVVKLSEEGSMTGFGLFNDM